MVAQLLDLLYIGCCRCDEMAHATNVFAGAGVRLAAGRAAFTPCDEALVPRVGDEVPVAIGRQNMDIASEVPAVNVGSGCPARRTVFFVRAGHGCQDAAAARVCTLR